MAESLRCTPETTTILFIGYAPIQNNKFKVKKKNQKTEFSSEDNNENNFVIILYIKKILLFPPADAKTDSIMTTWIGKGN